MISQPLAHRFSHCGVLPCNSPCHSPHIPRAALALVKVAFCQLGFGDLCSSATGDSHLALNDKIDKFLLVDDPLVAQ